MAVHTQQQINKKITMKAVSKGKKTQFKKTKAVLQQFLVCHL